MKIKPINFPRSSIGVTAIATTFLTLTSTLLHANTTQPVSEKLEEVVVVSSFTETPLREVATSVSVIDRDALEMRGFTALSDVLRTEAGIAMTNSGGIGKASTLRIRGEEGYRTLILVDGIDISDPTATQTSPRIHHLMTGNSIARVEILRGPQGFIYGADAGGVISITTQTPRDGNEVHLFSERGRYNTQVNSASWGLGSDTGSVFLSLDDVSTDGFNARESDTSFDEDGYENTTHHGKLTWVGDNAEGQFILRHTDAFTEFDNCYTAAFEQVNDCTSDYVQTIGKLNFVIDNEAASHNISLMRSDTKSDNYSAGEISWETDGGIEKVQYVGAVDILSGNKIVAGGDAKTEEFISDGELKSREQLSGFAEWQGNLNDRLYYTVGSRYDDNEDFGTHWSSRVSAAYLYELAGLQMKFRSSFGNGFRAPSLYEINYNNTFGSGEAATIELSEEKSRGKEVGVDVYFEDQTEISFVAFQQEVTDQIEFDLVAYSGYLQTEGTSKSKGYEFSFSKTLQDWLMFSSNITYNKALTSDNQQRVRRPKWLANLSLSSQLFNDDLRISINSRSLRDSIDNTREPLDDYTLIDLNAQYKWSENLSFHARIENATDRDDKEIGGFNTSGRALYAGIRIEL